MKLSRPWLILTLPILFCSVFASVSPNPFLRPGFNQRPTKQVSPRKAPPPAPQKDMSKEIEFRGYFTLKGEPFFCLFNKKSQKGEWIAINEATFEDFEAREFDLESETLTVAFGGETYKLNLLQSSSPAPSGSPTSASSRQSSSLPVPNKPASTASASQAPRYMPPKPQTTPELPPWLAERKKAFSASRTGGVSSSGRGAFPYPGAIPRRNLPGLPSSQAGGSNAGPSSTPSTSSGQSFTNRVVGSNSGSPSSGNLDSPPNSNSITQPVSSLINPVPVQSSSSEQEFDLDSLPPPPPPPNILPPSPPPNIIPTREE